MIAEHVRRTRGRVVREHMVAESEHRHAGAIARLHRVAVACAFAAVLCARASTVSQAQISGGQGASPVAADPGPPRRFGWDAGGTRIEPANVMDGDGLTEDAPRHAEPLDAQRLRDLGVPIGTSAAHVTRAELAAAGFVYVNPLDGSSVRKAREGFYAFHYRHDGKDEDGEVEVPSLVRPTLHVDLADDPQTVRYVYRVENGSAARQPIGLIVVAVPDGRGVVASSADDAWTGVPREIALPRTGWLPFRSHGLAPGGTVRGLRLDSRYLPAMTEARLGGVPLEPGAPRPGFPDDLARVLTQLTTEEYDVTVATLGPALAPGPWSAEQRREALDRLRRDVEPARRAGLVAAGDADRLVALFDAARGGSRVAPERLREALDSIGSLDPSYRTALGLVLREAIPSSPWR